ncbi:MAG: glycosyltransferase family 4 protein [Chloroflexi bacterium]|nr:glycosyltransferase family 4 protein [Chloroflexota bacterium]
MRVMLAQPYPRDLKLGSPKHFLRLGAALEQQGCTVEYLFLDDLPPRWRAQRLLYCTFPVAVAKRALSGRYDLVHVASGDAVLAAALRRRGLLHVPVVNHVLGVEHVHWQHLQEARRRGEEHVSWRHRLWFGGLRCRQVEASIRWSDHVLCSCRQDQRAIVARGWRQAGEVTVAPPGVDDLFLEAPPASLDSQTILFLGGWTFRKGIRDLVAAFAQVHAALPSARLRVAGAHAPRDVVLRSFPEELRPAVTVEAPSCPPEALPSLMRECALLVLPSLYEGFGMAFLEAMAVGLPVVGTPTGGMADLISPGRNGLLVPARAPAALAEAMIALLSAPCQRRALGQAARQTAQAHPWERAARETLAVYDACLNRAPARVVSPVSARE